MTEVEETMFKQFTSTRISEHVVEQIMSAISNQLFEAGEKLPGEYALAQQFGVSRTCVREALRVLEAMGIVEVRRGKGCFVTSNTTRTDTPWLSLLSAFRSQVLDTLQVREALESKCAELAADNASDVDREKLCSLVTQMEASIKPETMYMLDLEFHQAIARAGGNVMLMKLAQLIERSIEGERRAIFFVEGQIGESTMQHKQVLDAILRRDGKAAREAMIRHLAQVIESIKAL